MSTTRNAPADAAVTAPGDAAGADPLAPVRQALLARAREQAAAVLAEADAAAAAARERARAEGEALRAQARAHGAADAAAVLADERARARRRARRVVLAAQRDAYEELRRRTRTAVAGLAADPGSYPAVRAALAARARAELGADATVEEDPAGGVCARAGDRRVAYLLADLADLAVDGLGPGVEGLWAP